jgi:hypothetical protein
VTVGLHVADHGFDGGAAPQFALDDAEDAALLAGDKDAAWVLGVVAAVSLTWGRFGSRDAVHSCMKLQSRFEPASTIPGVPHQIAPLVRHQRAKQCLTIDPVSL